VNRIREGTYKKFIYEYMRITFIYDTRMKYSYTKTRIKISYTKRFKIQMRNQCWNHIRKFLHFLIRDLYTKFKLGTISPKGIVRFWSRRKAPPHGEIQLSAAAAFLGVDIITYYCNPYTYTSDRTLIPTSGELVGPRTLATALLHDQSRTIPFELIVQ